MKKIVAIAFMCIGSLGWANQDIESQNFWDVSHPNYLTYQNQAAAHINMEQNECAKFVNRLFKYRFDKLIWGNAWDVQLNEQNLKYISLEWQIRPETYDREKNFRLNTYQDRVKHFAELYQTIESDYHQSGIIGFLYRYSFAKDFLSKNVLPQTHVAFLAGKQRFMITNKTNKTQTLKSILENTYGRIHDHEINLAEQRLGYSLYQIILPGQSIRYTDYLVEQQFQKKIESVSILSIFLRKHRNNKKTPILRPVSFSRITNKVFK